MFSRPQDEVVLEIAEAETLIEPTDLLHYGTPENEAEVFDSLYRLPSGGIRPIHLRGDSMKLSQVPIRIARLLDPAGIMGDRPDDSDLRRAVQRSCEIGQPPGRDHRIRVQQHERISRRQSQPQAAGRRNTLVARQRYERNLLFEAPFDGSVAGGVVRRDQLIRDVRRVSANRCDASLQ